ncbi:hypothetical protein JGU66_14810 [Myxococcaceae bacterium JPH2]|nr:hypothetical protein [Myxococcaceae bacterium JPH2]
MMAWRGVHVLVPLLAGCGVGCGPMGWDDGLPGVGVESQELDAESCTRAPRRVGDAPPDGPPGGGKPDLLVLGVEQLFYSADDGVHGRELWASNGEDASTRMLRDVRPGPAGGTPRFLKRVGRQVFFVADDGVHGPELWKSDGTPGGTLLVKDVRPGPAGSAPDWFTEVRGKLYFTADDGVHGRELWVSDGTSAGTVLAREFAPGPAALYLDGLAVWNNRLVLVASGEHDVTIWALEPSGAAHALFRAPDTSLVFSLTPVGSRLFFLVDPGDGVATLWASWGLPLFAFPLRRFQGDYPASLTRMGDAVYFMAGAEGFWGGPGDGVHGGELWKSDGTWLGTRMVKDIRPGAESSLPSGLVVLDGKLYFSADDGVHGRELWRSDGTASGTRLWADLEPGPVGSAPEQLTVVGDTLVFSAATPQRGREAWLTEHLPSSSRRLTDIAPGPASSNPHGFVGLGGNVYFAATDGTGDDALWSLSLRAMPRCVEAVAAEVR